MLKRHSDTLLPLDDLNQHERKVGVYVTGKKNDLTFRFKDHHIAKFTLSLLIEALHLDVIGGLRLEVSDRMPVSVALHHVLLIVAVIIAVSRPVVDVEPVDGCVVYWSVLLRKTQNMLRSQSQNTKSSS